MNSANARFCKDMETPPYLQINGSRRRRSLRPYFRNRHPAEPKVRRRGGSRDMRSSTVTAPMIATNKTVKVQAASAARSKQSEEPSTDHRAHDSQNDVHEYAFAALLTSLLAMKPAIKPKMTHVMNDIRNLLAGRAVAAAQTPTSDGPIFIDCDQPEHGVKKGAYAHRAASGATNYYCPAINTGPLKCMPPSSLRRMPCLVATKIIFGSVGSKAMERATSVERRCHVAPPSVDLIKPSLVAANTMLEWLGTRATT